ncbi:MAG: Amuc_1099 family pilus-like system protein [Kiritimatiellia bacterium]
MQIQKITDMVKGHYEKLIGLVVIILLLMSLMYLAVQIGMIGAARRSFIEDIENVTPDHPEAEAVDPAPLEEALEAVRNPMSLFVEEWKETDTPYLTVPEKRAWCVDCRMPVPYDGIRCPFCQQLVPKDPDEQKDFDGDGDGMPDWWEIKHGFNPRDPSDAMQDSDDDGFTNLEEFMAGTDPRAPGDYPPIEAKLRLEKITADPFKLRFKTVSRLAENTRGRISRGAVMAFKNGPEADLRTSVPVLYIDDRTRGLLEERVSAVPEGSVVRFPEGEVVPFPEGAVIEFPAGAKIALSGEEEKGKLDLPVGSRVWIHRRDTAELPAGSVLVMPGGKSIELPEGSSIGMPEMKDVMLSPDTELAELPEGIPFTSERELRGRSTMFRIPEGSMVKKPDGTEIKIAGQGRLKLSCRLKFQLNLRSNKRTYFAEMGEEVQGFKLHMYKPMFESRTTSTGERLEDFSILTLRRGNKLIPLVKNKKVQYDEFIAHLHFALDNTEYVKRVNDRLDLRDKKGDVIAYEIRGIDSERQIVVIRRLSDEEEIPIRKFPEGDRGDRERGN